MCFVAAIHFIPIMTSHISKINSRCSQLCVICFEKEGSKRASSVLPKKYSMMRICSECFMDLHEIASDPLSYANCFVANRPQLFDGLKKQVAVSTIEEVYEALRNIFPSVTVDNLRAFSLLILCGTSVYTLITTKDRKIFHLTSLSLALLAGTYGLTEIFAQFDANMRKMFASVKAQGPDTPPSTQVNETFIIMLYKVLMTTLGIRDTDDQHQKRVIALNATFNLKNHVFSVLESIKKTLDYILTDVLGYSSKSLAEIKVILADCALFCEQVRIYQPMVLANYPDLPSALFDSLLQLQTQSAALSSEVARLPKITLQIAEFKTCQTLLNDWLKTCTCNTRLTIARDRPFGVSINGPSGIRKTTHLMEQVIKECYYIDHPDSKSFPKDVTGISFKRNAGAEYWEGYKPDAHFAICYDDAFVLDNAQAHGLIATELISVINNAPAPCNMANVDLKGKIFVNCSLVTHTSNNSNCNVLPPTAAVIDRDAIENRFPVRVSVSLARKFMDSKGRMDSKIVDSMIAEGVPLHEIYQNAYIFHTPEKGIMDYLTFFSLVRKMYKEHKAKNATIRSHIDSSSPVPDPVLPSSSSVDTYISSLSVPEPKLDQSLSKSEIQMEADSVEMATIKDYVFSNETVNRDPKEPSTLTNKFKDIWNTTFNRDKKDNAVKNAKDKHYDTVTYFSKLRSIYKTATAKDEASILHSGILEKKTRAKNYVLAAASLVAGVGTGYAAYKAYQWFSEQTDPQFSSGDNPTYRPGYVPTKLRRGEVRAIQTPQMKLDSNCFELAKSISKNIVNISYAVKTQESYLPIGGSIGATFVFDKVMLTAGHFLFYVPESANYLKIATDTKDFFVPWSSIQTYEISATDVVALVIDEKTFPQFPDISNHFCSEDDLKGDLSSICIVKKTNGLLTPAYGRAQKKMNMVRYNIKDDYQVTLDRALSLDFNATVPGDCGVPYLAYNTAIPRKLVAIHVCGSEYTSSGSIVTSADVEALKNATCRIRSEPQMKFEESVVPPCFKIIDKLPPSSIPRMPSKTEILPSALHHIDSPKPTYPARLKPFVNGANEKISPFLVAAKDFRIDDFVPDPIDKQIAKEILEDMLDNAPDPVIPTDPIPNDDVLQKIFGASGSIGAKMRNSPGYPYTLKNLPNGKEPFCENYGTAKDPQWRLKGEALESFLAYERDLQDNGTNATIKPIFNYVLKDQRVSLEKFEAGKTRLFTVMPLHAFFLRRKYFGAFALNHMQDPIRSPWSIGINPTSPQWKALFDQVNRWEDTKFSARDQKAFDKSMKQFINEIICQYIVSYILRFTTLKGEDLKKLANVLRGSNLHTYRARYIFLDWLVECLTSSMNPSGDFLTALFNSLYNYALFALCVIRYARTELKQLQYNMENFKRDFAFKDYGDDDFIGQCNTWWTPDVSVKMAAYYGHQIQDCDKSKKGEVGLQSLADITYLKRSFILHRGVVLAPLPEETLIEMTRWIRKSIVPYKVATTINCSTAMREFFMHGKDKYNEMFEYFQRELRLAGCPPMIRQSWESLFNSYQYNLCEPVSYLQMMNGENEVSGLTHFSDTSDPSTIENIPDTSPWFEKNDPYPNQGLETVLSRPLLVDSFTWSGANTFGTLLRVLDFPKIKFDAYTLNILKNYQYFKADVRLKVYTNANPMLYGELAVCYLPNYNTGGYGNRFSNVYQAVNNYSQDLSAGSKNILEFCLPYVAPTNFYNMDWVTDSNYDGYFHEVQIWVKVPLTNASENTITPSCTVTVFANFENITVAGLQLPQMIRENKEKNSKGLISVPAKVVSKIASAVSVVPIVGSAASVISKVADVVASVTETLGYTRNVNLQSNTRVESMYSGNLASADDLDTNVVLALTPNNAVANNPLYYSDEDYDNMQKYCGRPAFIDAFNFDSSYASGDLIMTKYLNPNSLFCQGAGTTTIYPSFLSSASSMHAFCKGGYKFKFCFRTSRFVTTRIRIVWTPFDTSLTDNILMGNVVNTVIDVTGDVDKEITFPYLRNEPWMHLQTSDYSYPAPPSEHNGILQVFVVNSPNSAASIASTKVYMLVYASGAEDFVLARPYSPSDLTLSTDAPQSFNITSDFEKTFPPLLPAEYKIDANVCMGEVTTSWTQLMSRYRPVKSVIYNSSLASVPDATLFTTWHSSVLDWCHVQYTRNFLFYRGSVNFRFLPLTNTKDVAFSLSNYDSYIQPATQRYFGLADGADIQGGYTKASVGVRIPWFTKYISYNRDYLTQLPPSHGILLSAISRGNATLPSGAGLLASALGSDFHAYWPLAPLPFSRATMSSLSYVEDEKVLSPGKLDAGSIVLNVFQENIVQPFANVCKWQVDTLGIPATVLLAPFYEEGFRYVFPWITTLFLILVEGWCVRASTFLMLSKLLLHSFLHYKNIYEGYFSALELHFLYNVMALIPYVWWVYRKNSKINDTIVPFDSDSNSQSPDNQPSLIVKNEYHGAPACNCADSSQEE